MMIVNYLDATPLPFSPDDDDALAVALGRYSGSCRYSVLACSIIAASIYNRPAVVMRPSPSASNARP